MENELQQDGLCVREEMISKRRNQFRNKISLKYINFENYKIQRETTNKLINTDDNSTQIMTSSLEPDGGKPLDSEDTFQVYLHIDIFLILLSHC